MTTHQSVRISIQVLDERERQDRKWGEQNHNDFVWCAILGEEFGEACQAALHDQFGGSHAGTLREELIHVAAVATQWIECIDRRSKQ
jgi:NTP pyrophosphatase (non-canonical NTP hydrolase)